MNDVKEIISFPTDLSENNDKEWFHATPSDILRPKNQTAKPFVSYINRAIDYNDEQ